ncbi:hypothetical protein RvY_10668 [Ramazzottius varieornatus]|uniref:Eukaryotic translation initiation factor 2 subunit 1 n=1 Tax=Ramazzottius varieornatus TaxID=947166 RepID=A0A1D1VDK2_RAMVA|nr:hypothetical protein RvY_10668 [Ramazzottius varieornatus]
MVLKCRYYAQKLPEIEDVVLANVRSIQEMGAYVDLQEYNDTEGMILLSELSRRRIRSINKLIRVGRSEVVVVIRVDKEKGYIDLSKRRVSQADIVKAEEKFAKAKAVNSILRHTAEVLHFKTDQQLEDLHWKTAWYFDTKFKKQAASYDVFKAAVTDPTVLDECNLEENVKEVLLNNIKRRLTPQAVKIRADVEVACYGYEGIDAVKEALRAGLTLSTEDSPVKINLIAPPTYVMTTTTLERTEGLKLLGDALNLIKERIEKYGGRFSIQMAPKVVTDTEETALAKHLEQLELANREVAGDDDFEEDVPATGDVPEAETEEAGEGDAAGDNE